MAIIAQRRQGEYVKSVRARDLLPSRSISRSFHLVKLSPLLFCGLARQPRIARLARIFSLASKTMQLASRKRESFRLYSFRWHFAPRKRASTNAVVDRVAGLSIKIPREKVAQ